jgi:hypothetical protein
MSTSYPKRQVTLAGFCAAVVLLACCAIGPSRPTGAHPIECAAAGETLQYSAVFTPGSSSNPVDTLIVTFRAQKPTSTEAEGVLRRCLLRASTAVRIDYGTPANAWFNNDDDPLPLIDGSSALFYNPKTGTTQTWNERQGVKVLETKREGYTVEYREEKTLVAPFGKSAIVTVVFPNEPEQAEIQKILAAELLAAVALQPTKLDTKAFANVGPSTDRAAQQQIRDAKGVLLDVEFIAKSGRVRDQDAAILRTIR